MTDETRTVVDHIVPTPDITAVNLVINESIEEVLESITAAATPDDIATVKLLLVREAPIVAITESTEAVIDDVVFVPNTTAIGLVVTEDVQELLRSSKRGRKNEM